MTVISFGKIIVWPRIPRLTAGINLHNQSPRDPCADNVTFIPVVRIDRETADVRANVADEARYNYIQKIISQTMRSQRYTKTSRYALEKLRKMHLDPA